MFRRTNSLPLGEEIRVWQKSHTPWQIADVEPTWYLPLNDRKPLRLYEITRTQGQNQAARPH